MKRMMCLLLALAVLLPVSAAVADPEEWEYQTNGEYTIRYPSYIQIYSVLEEDYGWNMDVLEDPEGTDSTGSMVGIILLFDSMYDWKDWLKDGSFPDERGNRETMERQTVDEPPVDLSMPFDQTYALYKSADGTRMLEVFILEREEAETDYVVMCRYPANDDGEYSDVLHWMLETLTIENGGGSSGGSKITGTRGSFRVSGQWDNDGKNKVVKDVIVNKKADNMYWLYATADVTKFRIERLTWNDRTFKVTKAKKLYSRKKLKEAEVISIRDWLPEILPTVRIKAVNAAGEEEVWYVSTNEENGDIILLSEEEVAY